MLHQLLLTLPDSETGTGYLVPYAVFQPIIAAWSDSFGRLPMFLFCTSAFTVGSIFASIARNITTMLVGRVVQGIGGGKYPCNSSTLKAWLMKIVGGICCLTVVIAADIIPLQHQPKWLGLVQLTWAFGLIAVSA